MSLFWAVTQEAWFFIVSYLLIFHFFQIFNVTVISPYLFLSSKKNKWWYRLGRKQILEEQSIMQVDNTHCGWKVMFGVWISFELVSKFSYRLFQKLTLLLVLTKEIYFLKYIHTNSDTIIAVPKTVFLEAAL